MIFDERVDSLRREILAIYQSTKQHDPSRICLVLDPPLESDLELVVALLPRQMEMAYRNSIQENSDLQLLWNPAEYPIYGNDSIRLPVEEGDFDVDSSVDVGGDFPLAVDKLLSTACSRANFDLNPHSCFVFFCDSELSRLRAQLAITCGIPEPFKRELPDWLK